MQRIISFAERHRIKIAFIALLVVFLAIKIQTLDIAIINRDEPLYAWQSLAMHHNPELVFSKEISYWYLFALVPAIAAPLNALVEPPVPVRIIVFLFSLAALGFTYSIGKKIFSKKVGLAAAIFLMLSPGFFYFSTKAMPDVPIAALGTALIYLLLTINRKRAVLLAFVLFAMYAIKSASLVMLPPTLIFFLLKYRHKIGVKKSAIAIVVAVALITAGFFLSPYKWLSLEIAWPGFDYARFFGYKNADLLLRVLGIPLSIFALVGAIKLRKKVTMQTGLLLLWIFSTTVPFFILKIWDDRSYLMAVPPLAIIAGQGLVGLFEGKKIRAKMAVGAAVIMVLAICAVPTIPLWGYDFDSRYQAKHDDLLGKWLEENVEKNDKVIILSPEMAMRSKRLSAEKALDSPREQMFVNPSREEFEAIAADNEKDLFLIINNNGGGLWFYIDLNREAYVEGKGFEKETEIKPLGPIYTETYLIYKKPVAKN